MESPGLADTRRGLLYGVGAYLAWGLSPIYWNWVRSFEPFELLAYRVLWALPILCGVIALRRGFPALRAAYQGRRTALIAATAGVLLAINWGVFIWAATAGHLLDVSLGYYINPLMSVALAVFVLHERLSRGAQLSVAIAALGVVVMTISLGVVPWIALVLAVTFALYGLLKKQALAAGPLEGLFGEMLTIAVPFGAFLALRYADGSASAADLPTHALIACSGLITIVPLLLFGASAQLIPLTTVGLLQYIAPTLHLIAGIWLYDETLLPGQLVGFATVWFALAIYTLDGLRRAQRLRAERNLAPG